MKKLMIALAAAAMAVASQAASFSWKTTDVVAGVTLANLNGNGAVSADGTTLTSSLGTFYATLAIYEAGTQNLIGSASNVKVTYNYTNPKGFKVSATVSGSYAASTAYDYVLDITGTQNDMKTYKTDTWDYTAATLSTQYKGTLTTASQGVTNFTDASPSTWTVDGAKKIEDVPEPTSGLLLLLGVAGLALKRKQK